MTNDNSPVEGVRRWARASLVAWLMPVLSGVPQCGQSRQRQKTHQGRPFRCSDVVWVGSTELCSEIAT